ILDFALHHPRRAKLVHLGFGIRKGGVGSTPGVRPSGAASPLDLFERPGGFFSTLLGVTALLAAGAVLLAAFIKGAIGFGFPTLGTPLLSLVMDVKAAVVVLILPNIVMDGLQFARRGAPLATVRRFAVLLVFGA